MMQSFWKYRITIVEHIKRQGLTRSMAVAAIAVNITSDTNKQRGYISRTIKYDKGK